MNEQTHPWTSLASCPFLQRMVYILTSEGAAPPDRETEMLFSRLSELEMKAEKYAAPPASRRAIERVRRIAGEAVASRASLPA